MLTYIVLNSSGNDSDIVDNDAWHTAVMWHNVECCLDWKVSARLPLIADTDGTYLTRS